MNTPLNNIEHFIIFIGNKKCDLFLKCILHTVKNSLNNHVSMDGGKPLRKPLGICLTLPSRTLVNHSLTIFIANLRASRIV